MTTEDKKNVLTILGLPMALLLLVIAFIPLGLFHAWVSQKMYGWFILPLGAPQLNLWHIWGLVLIVNYLKPYVNNDEKLAVSLGRSIFGGLIVLAIGYFVKAYI